MQRVRCAIYTRKSSDEGLEQDFNSLDAQYEACVAYIRSQASEGWKLVSKRYDDGGVSGGTLQRPALRDLLRDIELGQIDTVVVYKVDRLTRSLLDFSRLVEAFDRVGVTFVSVTQSFNTTTSMGRLTLNMLLSFAQFEREVTAERIRDKIAASKAKVMWMGGRPPLGYRPYGRSLAVIEEDASIVRAIFERYLALGNVRLLQEDLNRQAVVKPERETKKGQRYGGTPFNRAELYRLLGNPIYVGNIRHGEKIHAGLHPAIIDASIWEQTQKLLAKHVKGERGPRTPREKSLLAGLVRDADGRPLVASHACKGRRRYRYYVSRALQQCESKVGLRVPASELEPLVIETIAGVFERPFEHFASHDAAIDFLSLTNQADQLARDLRDRKSARCQSLVRDLVETVEVHGDRIILKLDRSAVVRALNLRGSSGCQDVLSVTLPARIARTGRMVRLIDGGRSAVGGNVDNVLVRLVAKGRHWWRLMLSEAGLTVSVIAAREGMTSSYVTRLMRLAFLSPEVLESIMEGRQPVLLDGAAITAPNAVALDWREQRRVLLA